MDAVMGFLNGPLVLTGLTMAFGLFVTYHPKAAGIPNLLISWLNAVIAFLVKVNAPQEAHATTLYLLASPMVSFASGLWGVIGSSLWTSVQSYLFFKVFAHDPLEKGLGWKKPAPTK